MPAFRALVLLVVAIGLVGFAPTGQARMPVSDDSFERDVEPVLTYVCMHCHKEIAGVPVDRYGDPASIGPLREEWEQIAQKLRAHEMPAADPDLEPLADEDRAAMLTFLDAAFERLDASAPIDPGRVTARRLNRGEYQNTIRDLLGIDFDAAEALLPDDTGYGFDNNGDVLTVSPALMQQYVAAAERIASRAVGGDPLPSPGVFSRRSRLKREGARAVELTEILSYDADYIMRVQVTGSRGDTDPPVTMVISVDGKPVSTVSVPVQLSEVNRISDFSQRVVYDVRVPLSANAHIFRAEFVGDDTLKTIPETDRRDARRNIFPDTIDIEGPFPLATPTAFEKKILTCDPSSGNACVRDILTTLARRAYRRPVTAADVSGLMRVFDRARDLGASAQESLQFAVTAVLVSPQFLFRTETDPAPNTVARISDVELASRLSYFLWSSMPDDELLEVAEKGRLHQPDVLEAQVRRMLADPKSGALADNFASQWLETRSLDAVTRDTALFPGWGAELREAMRTETRMFFDAMLREARPLADFIDGRFTYLNERLARHYGIDGIVGAQFRRVELDTPQRSGVFTQASVLTVSSYPTRTSVVLRGKFLLDNLFNAPPPAPPADIPAIDETVVGVGASLREQMETHRTEPICASCHVRMDPLGFALETYDAIGRWRTEDGAFPVDASGTFPNGRRFDGPSELKAILMDSLPEFTKGLSERMLTYALGRGVESFDRPAVRAIVRDTIAGGDTLPAMIQAIVRSAPFQMRRGESIPSIQEARRP